MTRLRRLRRTENIRKMVQETLITPYDLIQPFFAIEGKGNKETIDAMPGISRFSQDLLLKEVEAYVKLGGVAGIFFGIPEHKDSFGSGAYDQNGLIPKAIRAIKKNFPDFVVVTDVCLCAYTDHGHCGVIHERQIDNDRTLPLLGKMAVAHAQAGADFVAPSDMMDFRVHQIRTDLDHEGLKDTGIISYAVKYSSAYYGPFREAAHSSPVFGNRKTYQMDSANKLEAFREAKQDILEGADVIMVKPALAYLDVIHFLKEQLKYPMAAYSVSGEYSMVKAAAAKKWIDEKAIVLENLMSIKRSGADMIITYHAKEALKWIKE